MFSAVPKILSLLSSREKWRGALVLMLAIVMALIETAGFVSVMPFLTVLGNPNVIRENSLLRGLYDTFDFRSTNAFLIFLGAAAFGAIVVATAVKILAVAGMLRFASMRRHTISERLLAAYLRQPYEFFLNQNTADLSKTVLSEVDQLVSNVFRPAVDLVAYGITIVILLACLVVVDPLIALASAAVVFGMYALVYWCVREKTLDIGHDRKAANRERFTAATEAMSGIKEIKVLGCERAYLNRFRGPSSRFARHHATNAIHSQLPKFLIEAAAFGGLLSLTLVLMVTRQNLGEVLPVIGLYAIAGYRMLPAAQHVYAALTMIRFGYPVIEAVYNDLHQREHHAETLERPAALTLNHAIELKDVGFRYTGAARNALSGVNLQIVANSSVGFVGTTGAGKTTTIDLLLGLLPPTEGQILIDARPLLKQDVRAWQRAIGYVPQEIYLADISLAENIAFGLPPDAIDMQAVERAARIAQIHSFITSELEDGYQTIVGERGVRLSGGQRQRIGIARALYHDPQVLVFDEATSSLDSATEAALMDAIGTLAHTKTIIIVAHRLTTVWDCDVVYVLDHGRVVGQGTAQQLEQSCPAFQRLLQRSAASGVTQAVVDRVSLGE